MSSYGSVKSASSVPESSGGSSGSGSGSGGLILPANCWTGICDPSTLPADILADLGAGGWTNWGCNACPSVKGQYQLAFDFLCPSLCRWLYCAQLCMVNGAQNYLNLRGDILAGPKWEVLVIVSAHQYCGDNCKAVGYAWYSQALYQSAVFSGGSCVPPGKTIGLNRVSGANWSANPDLWLPPCNGALPASLTLSF